MKKLVSCLLAATVLWLLPAAAAAPRTYLQAVSPQYGVPVRIIIPRINVNAPVVTLGVDKNGYMEAPAGGDVVGWYGPGAKPGEKGNAVIDGHYDTETSSAIFYALRTLREGDTIFVVTDNDLVLPFTVYSVSRFDTHQFPVQEVFGQTDARNLNLITCEGEYDSLRHTYLERLVVFSRRS